MKTSVMLTVTSLSAILLLSIHIAEDIVLGFAPGGLTNMVGIAILVVYLCATLLWSDRVWGLVIVLLLGITAAGMPVLHMSGAGVGVKRSEGAYFFIWTLYALGMLGWFGVILSLREIQRLRRTALRPQ